MTDSDTPPHDPDADRPPDNAEPSTEHSGAGYGNHAKQPGDGDKNPGSEGNAGQDAK